MKDIDGGPALNDVDETDLERVMGKSSSREKAMSAKDVVTLEEA